MWRCVVCDAPREIRRGKYCKPCAKAKHAERGKQKTWIRLVANSRLRLKKGPTWGQFWTIEEDGVLMALWGLGLTSTFIGKLIPWRTPKSIQAHARYLGLSAVRSSGGRPRKVLREPSDRQLRAAVIRPKVRELQQMGLTYGQIAKKLGVTRSAVAGHASRLKRAPQEMRANA